MRHRQPYKLFVCVLFLPAAACNHNSTGPQPAQQDKPSTAAAQPSDQSDKGSISYAKNPERFVKMPVPPSQFSLKNPQTASDYFDLGVHEDNLQHYQDAISAYERALKLKPDWALVALREAKDYRRMGRTQDAINQFHRATKIDPHYWDAYSELALTYKDSGDTKNAIRAASKLLELPSLQIPTHNQLGYWYEEAGDKQKAREEFEIYRELSLKTQTEPQTERYQAALRELQKLSQ